MAFRIGLVVNPIAGVGGPVALKGSDDARLVAAALASGAVAPAPERARIALAALRRAPGEIELLAPPGPMGIDVVRAAGLRASALDIRPSAPTSGEDTRRIATALVDAGIDLLLFAGGDGTAVDVLEAVGSRVPALGIPAGVKMHSAVFGITPARAGEIAAGAARRGLEAVADAEVMDVDEDLLHSGVISPRLHGFLRVPVAPRLVQGGKARSAPDEGSAQARIAAWLIERVLPERVALLGPGTTTGAVAKALGIAKTVLGFDAIQGGQLLEADVDERTAFELTSRPGSVLVVAPVGGQGFLLGRGNQQLSPRVLRRVGRDGLVVAATEHKLAALAGAPLLVDTGDPQLDADLAGYHRVVTGYAREVVYRVSS